MLLNQRELDELRSGADSMEVMQNLFEKGSRPDDIPLDSFCVVGGAPDPDDTPEISVTDAQLDGTCCRGMLTAYFDEVVYGSGCPDMPTFKHRQGDLSFKVCLGNGTVTFEQ